MIIPSDTAPDPPPPQQEMITYYTPLWVSCDTHYNTHRVGQNLENSSVSSSTVLYSVLYCTVQYHALTMSSFKTTHFERCNCYLAD